jgi:hypothetical protein
MTFHDETAGGSWEEVKELIYSRTAVDARRALQSRALDERCFAALLSPAAGDLLEEIAQRARELGALVEGPVERPWNTRDVVVTDPDGYVLVFTEPVDMTATFAQVLENTAASPIA